MALAVPWRRGLARRTGVAIASASSRITPVCRLETRRNVRNSNDIFGLFIDSKRADAPWLIYVCVARA